MPIPWIGEWVIERSLSLTRIAPDEEAAGWTVRVVLALSTWPLPDAAAERRAVERFVEPVFRSRG
jgi:hypothetical protein